MKKPISAAVANREFSKLLQDVKKGQSYVITSHGKPVAKIGPVEEEDQKLAKKARTVLFLRLQSEPVIDIGSWSRDELYQR